MFLAAHGERRAEGPGEGPGDRDDETPRDARLLSLCDSVSDLLGGVETAPLLASDADATARSLARAGARPVVVLPLLFSDGYFFTRLRAALETAGPAGAIRRLGEPMIRWPGFAAMLEDEIRRAAGAPSDLHLVLIAHGSKTPGGASAQSARALAARLAPSFASVACGFLEEAPFAAEFVSAAPAPYGLAGLFLGEGLHGRDDFGALVEGAVRLPAFAFTAGALPGLARLIADRARTELETLTGGRAGGPAA
ncbi:MAG: hypothetical protein R3C52_02610 [Hyphomonadaceae bacterium]